MPDFSHLHVHTQFSLLDGAASISGLMKKAKADEMKAVALTDHGNMFGAFKFVAEANKQGIKPIVGCEFYLVEDRHEKQFGKGKKDKRYHQLFLAKDKEGYKNLSKLCSLGYTEGFYSKYPRIDKELVLKYHKGLIATSCCIGAEVPQAILFKGEEEAEKIFKWWLDLFGDDYYLELQRHNMLNIDDTGISQEDINQILLKWSKKYNVKTIATNDSHYINEDDADPHDVLLCINTGSKKNDADRFRFPNNQFFFKTKNEMGKLFADLPQTLENTIEIVDKVEPLKLSRDILLPHFPLPPGFKDQDDYLEYLTFEGAKKRYKILTPDIESRLKHELSVIKSMGFPGYFLIVQDFIVAGRNLGVAVGPGRGSAAGSAVAYCVGITNIDPIKYSLLFERFLNPERVSMPDIDIDFDDVGRQKVIDYVVDKYGKNQVAQIVTYGTMAAKMSIKDVARVMDLPLDQSNALTKLVPDTPGITLEKACEEVPELDQIRKGNDERGAVMRRAQVLEGSVRNTGIHASAIIIAPDDLLEYIPVCLSKESDLLVTQFDGKVIESAGMLKMDFLGLKTLTIIKDALLMIKKNKGIDIDIDEIPLDDLKTFELYQRGETVGTFQFESEGMRMYLKDLKPTNIEDLVAMNALYRPGPMQFIPNFIDRKHGKEPVIYPHLLLEGILKHTYGIMVYQEQIMQTAQILAGYSLGGADILRRAMGKKSAAEMEKQCGIFVKGANDLHNIPKKQAEEIFSVMEKFASYGFNRSHSAAYSVVAYQTAYLKANYPAEFMASVMTHSMGNIEKISIFMEECKRMGAPVLGPHINESFKDFDVNKKGQVRFGLGAIKGTGDAAVESIIEEREKNGPYQSLYDFVERSDLKTVNKKTFESLAQGGALDGFEAHRAQYFHKPDGDLSSGIEKIIKYGAAAQAQKSSSQISLFGGGGGTATTLPSPKIPDCEKWGLLHELKLEREVLGFYISGHPLDTYQMEMESFCKRAAEVENFKNLDIAVGGIVTAVNVKQGKGGQNFALFSIEDYEGTINLAMFGEPYLKHQHLIREGEFVYVFGKVQERYNKPGNWELSPKSVMLLADVKDKMCKQIRLKINLGELSKMLLGSLTEILEKNRGNQCELRVEVWEPEEKIQVQMLSRKYRVNPSNALIKALGELGGVKCEVG